MIPILHIKGLHDKFFHSVPVIYLKTQEDDFKAWFESYNLEKNHPIGSLYWSKNPTDPGTFLGGTWTPITDKFIFAAGTHPVDETGGAEKETLTVEQMPSHQHRLIGVGGIDNGKITGAILAPGDGNPDAMAFHRGGGYYDDGRYELERIGGGKAHNNMPPYITRYCWERTA